jgi:hypothetical protein
MYETPMLEQYGTFRELTATGNTAKRLGVNDLASVLNQQSEGESDNTGCNPQSQPWSYAGCMSQ